MARSLSSANSGSGLSEKIRKLAGSTDGSHGTPVGEAMDLGGDSFQGSRNRAGSLVKRQSESGLKAKMELEEYNYTQDSGFSNLDDSKLKRFSVPLGTAALDFGGSETDQSEGDQESESESRGGSRIFFGSSSSSTTPEKSGSNRKKKEDEKRKDKKQKKQEKQEKEQKRKREEDMKKQAQEEEIAETLLTQRRLLEDAQQALISTEMLETRLQKQITPLTKKLLAKGVVMVKSAKVLKNYPTNQKAKKEYLDTEKDFSDALRRFYLELGLTDPIPSSGSGSSLEQQSSGALSPRGGGSPESLSPPTSPPESPRFGTASGDLPAALAASSLLAPPGSGPVLRRTRSSTTNSALRSPKGNQTNFSQSSSNNARFLSPPRGREASNTLGSSSTPPTPPAKRNDREVKKSTQKKGEALAKLGELHTLLSSTIENFMLGKITSLSGDPSISTSTSLSSSTSSTTTISSSSTSAPSTSSSASEQSSQSTLTLPPLQLSSSSTKPSLGVVSTSSSNQQSNTSGVTIPSSNSGANLSTDPSISGSIVTGDSPEDEAARRARRVSVGRTFGRIISTKKNEALVTKVMNPIVIGKKDGSKIAPSPTPKSGTTSARETETLKMKKQQENFVMALFLAQRPPKEALLARKIISQSSFGVSIDDLLVGDQKIPTFISNVLGYLEVSGLEGKLFEPDPTLAPNIIALQQAYDSGKANLFDSSPRVVAGLLKYWLTLLPEPVIPVSIHADLYAFSCVKEPDVQVFDMVKSLIFKLPTSSRWLLKEFLNFFSIVARTNANGYTPQSLGFIFGHLLFKCSKESRESSTNVLAYLISQSTPLFQEVEPDISYTLKGGRLVFKSGTIQRLLSKLIDPYYATSDVEFLDLFLHTYLYYFSSAAELFEILQREYRKRIDDSHLWACNIRARICNALVEWVRIERGLKNDHELLQQFQSFCDNKSAHSTPREDSLLSSLAAFCKNCAPSNPEKKPLESAELITPRAIPIPIPLPTPGPASAAPSPHAPSLIDIMTIDTLVMAQHVTAMDKLLFERIPLQEFLKKNFTKPATSPLYTEMAKRFNQWSQWVCTEIVQRQNIQNRVDVLGKFISIAKACRDMNNFNTSYAIIAGLDQSAVSRLKQTWEKLPKTLQSTFEELKELFNIQLNHKNYRDALQMASLPLVPYLGLYGKFLLAIEDGNPVRIEGGTQINWTRFRKIFKLIDEIRVYQSSAYSFPIEAELFSNLRTLVTLNDEETFKLSLICEPRVPVKPGGAKAAPVKPSPDKGRRK